MQKDHSFGKEEETDRAIISLKTVLNELENPGTPVALEVETPDAFMGGGIFIKDLKTKGEDFEDASPTKKKGKTPKAAKSPKAKTPKKNKERRPSVTFNLTYKYTENPDNHPKRSNMISYIEESFKLNKVRDPVPLPDLPKKQLFISLGILAIAIVCFIVGAVTASSAGKASSGIPFWIIGALSGLPGLFYASRFCRACYSRNAEGRRKALEDVPQE